ncbi:MAG: DUF2254 domain-containing protein [Planctomycetes bacterium]|nr:DUF2254 domain-containing protein [Planctomycetota bacterium]
MDRLRTDRYMNRLALRILGWLVLIFVVLFSVELLVDLKGSGVRPGDLSLTPRQVQAVASTVSRAFNNLMAMVLAFIALAIPITANMYTPKLIEIFVRDRINLAAMILFAAFGGHAIFAQAMAYEQWSPTLQFTICWTSGVLGFTLLVPYYLYVLSFLDPDRIIDRVTGRITAEFAAIREGRRAPEHAQRRFHARIQHLGNVVLRALDRNDRDVCLSSIRALRRAVHEYLDAKREFPPEWFAADPEIFVGISGEALATIREDRVWVEHRCLSQLLLAYGQALAHMQDAISAISDVNLSIARKAVECRDEKALDLGIRFFNTFLRAAIKRRDVHAIQDVLHQYKFLARDLLGQDPLRALAIARHFKYYAEFARHERVPFVYELIAYDLAAVTEWAWESGATTRVGVLDLFLSLDAQDTTVRMTTARAILAGFLRDGGHEREAALVADRLYGTSIDQIRRAYKVLVGTVDPTFWEITDLQRNLDYVAPARRETIARLLEDVIEKKNAGG